MQKSKDIKKDIISLTILFFLLMIFFEAIIFRGQFFYKGDIINLTFPAMSTYAEGLKKWALPLWTPYIASGFPLMAEGQTGVFYPINMFLFLIFSPYIAYNYSIVLHFFLLGIFTYIYARSINIGRSASLASAIILTFSGFFVTRLEFISILQSAIWLPLIFFFIEMGFRKNRVVWGIFAGFVLAVQFLGGHPQFTMYSLLGSSLYFMFHLILDTHRYRGKKRFFRIILLYVSCVFLGLGISAIQLLPTYELTLLGERAGGVGIDFATKESFSILGFITFIFPYLFSINFHFWESCAYVGIFPLILSLLAILIIRNRYVLFFSILLAVSLLLSLGKNDPLQTYSLLHFIPGFNYFRFISRFLYLTSFSLAILAGIGFDFLLVRLIGTGKEVKRKISIILKSGCIGLTIFLFGRLPLQAYIMISGQKTDVLSKLLYKTSILNPNFFLPLLNILFALTMLYLWKRGIKSVLFKSSGLLIIIFDLFMFGMRYNPTIPANDIISMPKTAIFLENRREKFPDRIYVHKNSFARINKKGRELLQGNYIMLFSSSINIYSINIGNVALWIKRYYDLLEVLKEGTNSFIGKNISAFSQSSLKLLNLLNARYILTPYKLNNSGYRLVFDEEVKIYENQGVLPKTFIVSKAKIINEEKEILREIKSEQFNPEEYIILEERPLVSMEETVPTVGSTAEITEYSSREVNVFANLTEKGFLFLSDIYYPGWKVYVDGIAGKIYRADYIFRAVYLDRGQHRVKFVYEPSSFKVGMLMSAISIVISICVLIAALKRTKI